MNKKYIVFLMAGAMCATSLAQDWSAMHGAWKRDNQYKFYWDMDDTGLSAVVSLQVNPANGSVQKMWEAWLNLPDENGFSSRFFVSSGGQAGYAAQTFKDGEMHLHWLGRKGGGGGHGVGQLSADGNSFENKGGFWLGGNGFMETKGSSKPFIKMPGSHEKGWKNLRDLIQSDTITIPPSDQTALFDSRLQPLLGRWQSTRPDGSIALEILWRGTCMGAFLLERYSFYDEKGNVSASGINISGNDPLSSELVMWGNSDRGFYQKGGWDFQGNQTLIQREGSHRLLRRFVDEKTIQAHWEQKVDGQYQRNNDQTGYELTKLPSSDEAESLLKESTKLFTTAFNAGDISALKNFYTADSVKLTARTSDPLIGWKAIEADFQGRIGGPDKLAAAVEHAFFVSPEYLIGAGSFSFVAPDGATKATGKWGNVWRVQNGQCVMVQEVAFQQSSNQEPFDASEWSFDHLNIKEAREENAAAFNGADQMVKDYLTAWGRRDAKALASVFDHGGLRVVSGVVGVRRDHLEIEASFRDELQGVSANVPVIMQAVTMGARSIGGRAVLAYGKWQVTSVDDGKVMEAGLWGNVFRKVGDEVRILLESGGTHQPQ